jgi:hypothetical protein
MKKSQFFRFVACSTVLILLTACASARCDCENNRPYKSKKGKISLINYQKNTTFALKNSGRKEL